MNEPEPARRQQLGKPNARSTPAPHHELYKASYRRGFRGETRLFICDPKVVPAKQLHLTPLGDQAILARFDREDSAIEFANQVRQLNEPWLVDVVSAYCSVAVYFDLDRTSFEYVANQFHLQSVNVRSASPTVARKNHQIPCCYDFQLDLARVAEQKELTSEAVIRFHVGTNYTVYAIGFCPGFPYLGYLPLPLAGTSRLASPRIRVEPGSVGLTGRQTGIYTQAKPGGWNLIGRTPLALVHVADNYFPLRTGDQVRFTRIDEREFQKLQGQRL